MTEIPDALATKLEDALTQRLSASRRRAFALAKRFAFTRQERIDFAVALTGVEVTSWNDLTYDQLRDIIIGMEGAAHALFIQSQRSAHHQTEHS